MGYLYRGVEVAATERLIGAPQAVDDLLISVGHRPRSISRRLRLCPTEESG
jgi:hypothetical protein